ncbi:hypothetical protein [Nocardia sp. NPDC004860]|uniref:hypothetical protein n=1 Tax=Nocardia sp. NPDC004860 TaxID=3154557 RepID=UPI0033AF48B0
MVETGVGTVDRVRRCLVCGYRGEKAVAERGRWRYGHRGRGQHDGFSGLLHFLGEGGAQYSVVGIQKVRHCALIFVADRSERDSVREIDLAFFHLTSLPNFS